MPPFQRKMSPLKFLPGKLRDFNGRKWLEVSSRLLFWWTICVYSEPFPNYVIEWETLKKILSVFPWQNVLPGTSLSFIWVAKSTTGSEKLVRTFFLKAANNFRAPGSQEDPFSVLCLAHRGGLHTMKTEYWAPKSLGLRFPTPGPGYRTTQPRQ